MKKRLHKTCRISVLFLAAVLAFSMLPITEGLSIEALEESPPTVSEPSTESGSESSPIANEPETEPGVNTDNKEAPSFELESKSTEDLTGKSEAVYNPQPTSMQEVQAAIDVYETEYFAVLETEGFSAALQVEKPHWQDEVSVEIMPKGYNCQLVEGDEDFCAKYYTFFANAAAMVFVGSGGDGSSGNPYQISSEADLIELRTSVNGGTSHAGDHFVLTDDIPLSGTWTPIGTASTRYWLSEAASYPYVYNGRPFSGIFDGSYNGQNHSITSLTTTSGNFQGLFGYVANATIKNLAVTTSTNGVSGALHVGALVAYATTSTIDECSVIGTVKTTATNTDSYTYVAGSGGLVGGAEKTTIKNCGTKVTVIGGCNTGGLLGLALHGTTVDGCFAQGSVTATGRYVGGLVGHAYQDYTYYSKYTTAEKVISITNSNANVSIVCSSNETGGLIGKMYIGPGTTNGFEINVADCSAFGSVTGTNSASAYYGGLIGMAYAYSTSASITIKNCHATGDIVTQYYVIGGLIGYAQGNVTIDFCRAAGNVTGTLATAQDVGGLIGLTDGVDASWNGVNIKNSYATGEVYGGYYQVGGFIGEAYSNTKIENCYAAGNVRSNCSAADWFYGVGGFIGSATYAGSTIKNSYALGRVEGIGAQQRGSFIGSVSNTNTNLGGYPINTGNLIIENCYAAGTVTGAGTGPKGGFIGRVNNSRVMIINSFFDTTMTGTSTPIGSLTVGGTVTGSPGAIDTETMIDKDTFLS